MAGQDRSGRQAVNGRIPINMIGSLFFIAHKYFFLNGIQLLASPFYVWGLNLHSRFRREAINHVIRIYETAQKAPALTAAQLLRFYDGHPDELRRIKKKTGSIGLNFILDSLKLAESQAIQAGTPLSKALQPIVAARENLA